MARKRKFGDGGMMGGMGGFVSDAIGPSGFIGDDKGNVGGIPVDPAGDMQKKWIGVKGQSMIGGGNDSAGKDQGNPSVTPAAAAPSGTTGGGAGTPQLATAPSASPVASAPKAQTLKKGGLVKGKKSRDGIAQRGKTRGRVR